MKKSPATYQFFPPECCVVSDTGYSGRAADVWALGLTVYSLVFSKLPFCASSVDDLFETIQNFELELPEEIDPQISSLLIKLLQKEPQRRMELWEGVVEEWGSLEESSQDAESEDNSSSMWKSQVLTVCVKN